MSKYICVCLSNNIFENITHNLMRKNPQVEDKTKLTTSMRCRHQIPETNKQMSLNTRKSKFRIMKTFHREKTYHIKVNVDGCSDLYDILTLVCMITQYSFWYNCLCLWYNCLCLYIDIHTYVLFSSSSNGCYNNILYVCLFLINS